MYIKELKMAIDFKKLLYMSCIISGSSKQEANIIIDNIQDVTIDEIFEYCPYLIKIISDNTGNTFSQIRQDFNPKNTHNYLLEYQYKIEQDFSKLRKAFY